VKYVSERTANQNKARKGSRLPAPWLSVAAAVVTGAVLLVSGVVSSSPGREPAAREARVATAVRPPDPERIDDALSRFLNDWPKSSIEDRAAMARFFGYFKFEPAMELLRKEASRLEGDAAVASLQALAAMGDLDSLPIFRNVIRTSRDPGAVRLAATVLATWVDRHSYSTLILSLLHPRCDGDCVVLQVKAMLRVKHPFLPYYLFLIHRVSTSPTARLAATAALATKTDKLRREPSVVSVLRQAVLDGTEGVQADEPGSQQTLALALWGMGRLSSSTCSEARQHAISVWEQAENEERARFARTTLAAALPCIRLTNYRHRKILERMSEETAMEIPEEADRQPMPVFAATKEHHDDAIDPPWVDWLVQLTTRFTLWDESGSVQQFARAIEKIEQTRSSGSKELPSEQIGPDRNVRVPRSNLRRLDRQAADFSPPADFDHYQFTPGQPDWWPANIDLTIDDGPRLTRLRKILAVLDGWGVKATFFFIGANVTRHWIARPDYARNMLQGMLDMGHRIGYHSMNHQTRWFRHLQAWTPAQIRDDIELFEAVMSLTLGEAFVPAWGRLPGGMGRKFRHVRRGLYLGGLKASVEWDMEEEAWGPATSNYNLRKLAVRLVESKEDTVILLHEYAGLDRQLAVFVGAVHDAVRAQATVGDQRGEAGEGAP